MESCIGKSPTTNTWVGCWMPLTSQKEPTIPNRKHFIPIYAKNRNSFPSHDRRQHGGLGTKRERDSQARRIFLPDQTVHEGPRGLSRWIEETSQRCAPQFPDRVNLPVIAQQIGIAPVPSG